MPFARTRAERPTAGVSRTRCATSPNAAGAHRVAHRLLPFSWFAVPRAGCVSAGTRCRLSVVRIVRCAILLVSASARATRTSAGGAAFAAVVCTLFANAFAHLWRTAFPSTAHLRGYLMFCGCVSRSTARRAATLRICTSCLTRSTLAVAFRSRLRARCVPNIYLAWLLPLFTGTSLLYAERAPGVPGRTSTTRHCGTMHRTDIFFFRFSRIHVCV